MEAALAMLPLMAFFGGIVDVSFAVFKNTLRFAVRQGVRYAVTSQTTAGKCPDASIKSHGENLLLRDGGRAESYSKRRGPGLHHLL